MALLTILSVAAEIASDEKAMASITKFTKKGINAIGNLMRDEDDLPPMTSEDFEKLVEFTEMLASLLGLGAKADDVENQKKMEVIDQIFTEICFSNTGYMQESLLNHIGSSIEEFGYTIAAKIQEPYTIKKVTNYVEKNELEDLFYSFLARVMYADENISGLEQEYLDAVADSFKINKFDRRSIENRYKKA